jgi:hypothetical protein
MRQSVGPRSSRLPHEQLRTFLRELKDFAGFAAEALTKPCRASDRCHQTKTYP